jgi:hypothetical protein
MAVEITEEISTYLVGFIRAEAIALTFNGWHSNVFQ